VNDIEAASLIALLAAAFPSAKISKETVSVYVSNLDDISYEDGRRAVDNLLRTSDFFPSLAALRREALGVAGLLSPPREQAWLEVEMGMRTKGRGVKIEWSHPAIETAVRTMGWTNMCLSENLDVVRGQFFKVYDSISQRNDREAQTGHIAELVAKPVFELEGVVKSL
jgi:hypothetical protein